MRHLVSTALAALATACVFPTSFDEQSIEVTDSIHAIDVWVPTGDIDIRGADVDAVTGQAGGRSRRVRRVFIRACVR